VDNFSTSRSHLLPINRRASFADGGYGLPLVLSLGVLLALRLIAVYAAQIDLGRDEAQYWIWSRELAFGYFSKPPMIAWVIRSASELCGQSEACIRSASPALYTAAAFMLFLTGRAVFNAKVGYWSAVVFATLPGVSLSSHLITTDVPLILFWAARFCFTALDIAWQNDSCRFSY
jgi:4-amino-4-deoxy-L-arabinose transferase-like glycosyltransferase